MRRGEDSPLGSGESLSKGTRQECPWAGLWHCKYSCHSGQAVLGSIFLKDVLWMECLIYSHSRLLLSWNDPERGSSSVIPN